jgi:hypothetical protein
MPNWCRNELIVSGEPEDLTKFREMNERDGELTFEALLPNPPELLKEDADEEWYLWRLSHWGTKWDANAFGDTKIVPAEGDERLIYTFQTAWSPPLSWVQSEARTFPTLKIDCGFYEPAMEVAGLILCHGENIKYVDFGHIYQDYEGLPGALIPLQKAFREHGFEKTGESIGWLIADFEEDANTQ